MLYKENIKQSDIENLELLDKFPKKRAIRINGGATKEKSYGNFSLEGEGNVRLFIFSTYLYDLISLVENIKPNISFSF